MSEALQASRKEGSELKRRSEYFATEQNKG